MDNKDLEEFDRVAKQAMFAVLKARSKKMNFVAFVNLPVKITMFKIHPKLPRTEEPTLMEEAEADLGEKIFLLDIDPYNTAPMVNTDAFFYPHIKTATKKGDDPTITPMLEKCMEPMLLYYFKHKTDEQNNWPV